jgi:hypothetical protein
VPQNMVTAQHGCGGFLSLVLEPGRDGSKIRGFGTGSSGIGFSRNSFGIFWDFKILFRLLILRLSSTMMCSLAPHLTCLDRSYKSLNEYKHCGQFLFLTLLCTHLMCLDISLESLNEEEHFGHLLFLTFLSTNLMCLDRSQESLDEYKHCGHLLILTLLFTHLMCLDRSPESLNE